MSISNWLEITIEYLSHDKNMILKMRQVSEIFRVFREQTFDKKHQITSLKSHQEVIATLSAEWHVRKRLCFSICKLQTIFFCSNKVTKSMYQPEILCEVQANVGRLEKIAVDSGSHFIYMYNSVNAIHWVTFCAVQRNGKNVYRPYRHSLHSHSLFLLATVPA